LFIILVLLLRGVHNKHLRHTTCPASVLLEVLGLSQPVRRHLFVAHTEELLEAPTDVAEAWHHAKAPDRSNLKDSSRHCRSMADLLAVVVGVGADLLPVVDKQTAKPLRTRTRLPTEAILAAIYEAVLRTLFPVDGEASRAGAVSLSLTTRTPPKELSPTTRTSSRETTRMYLHRPI
jgi:hypothetical protein